MILFLTNPINLPRAPIPPKFRATILIVKPQVTPMVTNDLINSNFPKLIIIPIVNDSLELLPSGLLQSQILVFYCNKDTSYCNQ